MLRERRARLRQLHQTAEPGKGFLRRFVHFARDRLFFMGLAIGEQIAIFRVVMRTNTAQGALSPLAFPLFPTLRTSQVL